MSSAGVLIKKLKQLHPKKSNLVDIADASLSKEQDPRLKPRS